jgi:hypothetical protein
MIAHGTDAFFQNISHLLDVTFQKYRCVITKSALRVVNTTLIKLKYIYENRNEFVATSKRRYIYANN